MSLTPAKKSAMIEYYVRGASTKAILEDEPGFEDISREEIAEALDTFATVLDTQLKAEVMPPLVPGDIIKGTQWGVRFIKRGKTDKHICVQLMGEDDEHWFDIGKDSGNGRCSSFWVPDLINVLQLAQAALETRAEPSECGFGYRFRE